MFYFTQLQLKNVHAIHLTVARVIESSIVTYHMWAYTISISNIFLRMYRRKYAVVHWFSDQLNKRLSLCTGCSGKIVFFHNPLQPLPHLHRCKRPSKINASVPSVQSLLLPGNFCTTNSSRVLARERRQTFENSWEKTQYLMNTLYNQYQ